MRRDYLLIMTTMFFVLFSVFFSLLQGSTAIPVQTLLLPNALGEWHPVLSQIRLPRTLGAFVSGGLLSLAGILMQLLLQNPLADPYILGISGGAAFVTLLMMLFATTAFSMGFSALMGALLTIMMILLFAKKHRWHSHTLLLIGMALACIFSAGISFILILSPDKNLHSMLFWLTGDLNGRDFPYGALTVLSGGLFISQLLAPGFNILARGEREALVLGLAVQRYRIGLYFLSAALTATAVTLAGCIGFVGLIIPHLTRRLVGVDHRVLIPLATALGGSLVVIADTLARTLFAPTQLPVGIVIAFIGIPFFIWLLPKPS
ncbi:MAG: iron ABC transporter permease [Gammaproteobacteria bacterium]|nr:iron ABC transporter permease [Gammaproteobacteria bacterium]